MSPLICIKPGERQEYVLEYISRWRTIFLSGAVLLKVLLIAMMILNMGIIFLHKLKMVSSRIIGYFENVIPNMFSTENFRYHFRISKEMFEEI